MMGHGSHSIGMQREAGIDALEALRRAAYEYVDPKNAKNVGVPAIAAKMGMPPGTLYNKLNLHNENLRCTPTVQDLIQILAITGDLRVLSALNQTFGCVCFPVPDLSRVSDDALLELITRMGAEHGQFHGAVHNALLDRRCSAQKVATIHREGHEAIGAVVEVMARMEGLVDVD